MKWYKVWTTDFSAPVLILKADSLAEAIATAKRENAAYSLGEEYKQANKCRSYCRQQIKEQRKTWNGHIYYVDITIGVCYYQIGGRPRRCQCNGSKSKCDFHPHRRTTS